MSIQKIFGVSFLLLVTAFAPVENQELSCPPEAVYYPCSCYYGGGSGLQITCFRVPLEEVRNVFQRTTDNDMFALYLSPLDNETFIPADLLGDKRFQMINLNCPYWIDGRFQLEVDPDAFRSGKNFTNRIGLDYCNMQKLDFTFLTRFNETLNSLDFQSVTNIHRSGFQNLPVLPKLSAMYLREIGGLDESTMTFPTLVSGLKTVYLYYNNWVNADETMSRALDWILSSSADTLSELIINNNYLRVVPQQITSFKKLEYLTLSSNDIIEIPAGSFAFPSPIDWLNIVSCRVTTVEAGAFQGNYSVAKVSLFGNELTRLEESVFLDIMQQMHSSTGSLDVVANPFDCSTDPCHLAWLIRDHRELLPVVRTASCSNFTYFSDLDPNAFNDCPARSAFKNVRLTKL